MVRLVSAQPPKIDGVEGGSATPSSTPTPKLTDWNQVEERQQRNRSAAQPRPIQPIRPTTEPEAPAAPRVRPDGATLPAPEAPKVNATLSEIPGMTRFGKKITGATYIPGEGGFPAPWRGQVEPFGGRPVPGATAPTLTGAQRFGNSIIGTAEQFGSVNPFKGWKSGGKTGVLMNIATTVGLNASGAGMQKDLIAQSFQDQGYPKDVADEMATAYIGAYGVAGGATSLAAEAISDASFMAASATVGAAIGSLFFGIGAIPGAAAGAAAGWSASRVIAGVSAMTTMVEGILSMGGAVINKAEGTPENIKMVNLPTLDDFWIHGGVNEDGTPRNGLFGLNVRSFFADQGDKAAMAAANSVVTNLIESGRFYTDEETLRERKRIEDGWYASSADVDPKYQFYKQFIQEGYFVYQDAKGDYKVDTEAVQNFLWDNARYKTEADLRSALPEKKAVGDRFYKSVRLTDSILSTMWSYPDIMP